MDKNQTVKVKDELKWDLRGYEEYISGYKMYKRLKGKWDKIEREENSNFFH